MKNLTEEIELSEGLLKALALKQYLGDDYFILDGKAYEGTEDEAREDFTPLCDNGAEISFSTWCAENLIEVDEYEENNGDYLVLTDSEADEKAAEYIKDTLWAFNASFLAAKQELTRKFSRLFKPTANVKATTMQ